VNKFIDACFATKFQQVKKSLKAFVYEALDLQEKSVEEQ